MKTNSSSNDKGYCMVSKIRLVKEPTDLLSGKITTSSMAHEFALSLYDDDMEIYESFFVLFLNRANVITDYTKLSQGGCTGTIVDPKLILKYAIDNLTQAVILVHNHPSGNTSPSEADKSLTDKMVKLLNTFEIQVLDHIIVTVRGFFSFADMGLIQNKC